MLSHTTETSQNFLSSACMSITVSVRPWVSVSRHLYRVWDTILLLMCFVRCDCTMSRCLSLTSVRPGFCLCHRACTGMHLVLQSTSSQSRTLSSTITLVRCYCAGPTFWQRECSGTHLQSGCVLSYLNSFAWT